MNLSIEKVGKLYRNNVRALDEFSLEIGPGVFGLLGPNGAGKSTLMRVLATITRPTLGRVLWDGIDTAKSPNALRTVLGYLPQDFGVYPNLNAIEFLEYLAAVRGLDGRTARKRIQTLLELVNLAEVSKRPLGGYSGGMKQRVGIAQALLNDPRLLIVDEPTSVIVLCLPCSPRLTLAWPLSPGIFICIWASSAASSTPRGSAC
jgi:ABC-2 type transport system ATP-binding protein